MLKVLIIKEGCLLKVLCLVGGSLSMAVGKRGVGQCDPTGSGVVFFLLRSEDSMETLCKLLNIWFEQQLPKTCLRVTLLVNEQLTFQKCPQNQVLKRKNITVKLFVRELANPPDYW